MRTWFDSSVLAVAVLATILVENGLAAQQQILGRKLLVQNPDGDEANRRVVLVAKESATDIAALAGNPVADGAALLVGVNSGSTGQFFFLEASGWSATSTGFRYRGPTDLDGDPVAKVILRRTPSGTALLKVTIKGSVGVQPLTLVPPNPGADAVAMLSLTNGDTYCAAFGGAAAGQIAANTSTTWKVRNATQQPPCPDFCCTFGLSCAWTEGDQAGAAECVQAGGTLGFPGSACDGATGACSPPPAAAGNCCAFGVTLFCFGGPGVQQPPCEEFSGTFSTNAICDPDLSCVTPP
jgi:hypothetical protein